MALFAHKVNRVTIMGTCFGGQEIWTTGFWLGQEGADAADVTPPQANAVATLWQTFFTHADSGVNNNYKTTQIKIAQHAADGLTNEDNVEYYVYGTAITGGYSANPMPPQTALVATLQSSNVRGIASKGRMYLPGICHPLDGTGKLTSYTNGLVADHINTFLSGINTDSTIPDFLVNASHGSKATLYTNPANKRVEHVRVGNVYDTQRRRRNAFVETYLNRDIAQ
jgi:hypothetical protein